MPTPATRARFTDDTLSVHLTDGRVPGLPLAWFARLPNASPALREAVEISPFGLHWPGLDEDISVAGLMAGQGDKGRVGKVA